MGVNTYIHTYIHTYMHAYIHTCMHAYIHTYIHTYIRVTSIRRKRDGRGELLHSRNRHLRNHCGFSLALFFLNYFSVAFSNRLSLVSGVFQMVATFPVDFYRKFPMTFPMVFSNNTSLLRFMVCILLPRTLVPPDQERVEKNTPLNPEAIARAAHGNWLVTIGRSPLL